MKKNLSKFFILGFIFMMLVACAGPNTVEDEPSEKGKVAGFWRGLIHGLFAVPAFIISFFANSVHFYEVHNSGFWYNLGFLLGIGAFAGGSSSATRRN